jgi:hypothetical protein
MREILIIFCVLLLLLIIISTLGGSIQPEKFQSALPTVVAPTPAYAQTHNQVQSEQPHKTEKFQVEEKETEITGFDDGESFAQL